MIAPCPKCGSPLPFAERLGSGTTYAFRPCPSSVPPAGLASNLGKSILTSSASKSYLTTIPGPGTHQFPLFTSGLGRCWRRRSRKEA